MQKLMNKSKWGVGHGVLMSQLTPPGWIVHETAISEGVDSALVLGDIWVMGQGCCYSTMCWAGR
jgi:hypothetical protein